MKMLFRILLICCCTFLITATFGQAKTIKAPSYGYSFTAPVDWIHQDIGNGYHLLGSNAVPGFILIMPHTYSDKTAIKALAQTEGIIDQGISLQAVGAVEYYGKNGISGTFKGITDGELAEAAALCLFSPHGGGILILAMTSPAQFNTTYMQLAEGVAKTVKFSTPVESQLAKTWRQGLTHKKLVYYNTTSTSSEKNTYYLYHNGTFEYAGGISSSSTNYYSDQTVTISSAGTDADAGQWTVVGDEQSVQLYLVYNNGNEALFNLQLKEGTETQILLNGDRYFVQDLE